MMLKPIKHSKSAGTTLCRLAVFAMYSGIAMSAQADESIAPKGIDPESILATIPSSWREHCRTLPDADADLPKDEISTILDAHTRYRLVIGASQFAKEPEKWNLPAVEPTVELIDARLQALGYTSLPSRQAPKKPYLTGSEATLDAIKAALIEITQATEAGGYGVVYFAGHGTLAPNRADVILSVYDRPVTESDGLRLTDLIGELTLGKWQLTNELRIANFLVLLDTCNSGDVLKRTEGVMTEDAIQRIVRTDGPTIPQRVVLITATADGQLAYSLKDINLTAFGAYVALALKEDWTCADQNFDGVITSGELTDYLRTGLSDAKNHGGLPAAMRPQGANTQDSIAAYNAKFYKTVGERKALDIIQVDVDPTLVASIDPQSVSLSDGVTVPCASGCRIAVPADYAGNLQIRTVSFASTAAPANETSVNGNEKPASAAGPLHAGTGLWERIGAITGLRGTGGIGGFGAVSAVGAEAHPPQPLRKTIDVAVDDLKMKTQIRTDGLVVKLTNETKASSP